MASLRPTNVQAGIVWHWIQAYGQHTSETIVIVGDLPAVYEIEDNGRCVPAHLMRNNYNK
jgi:hypothetical protein